MYLVPDADERSTDRQAGGVEFDVTPAKTEEFPATHAGVCRDPQSCMQAMIGTEVENVRSCRAFQARGIADAIGRRLGACAIAAGFATIIPRSCASVSARRNTMWISSTVLPSSPPGRTVLPLVRRFA